MNRQEDLLERKTTEENDLDTQSKLEGTYSMPGSPDYVPNQGVRIRTDQEIRKTELKEYHISKKGFDNIHGNPAERETPVENVHKNVEPQERYGSAGEASGKYVKKNTGYEDAKYTEEEKPRKKKYWIIIAIILVLLLVKCLG
ncbi:MAG: hypothetical protein Q4G11_01300 [Gallicola sp.]|nr:hypothetical protein [Gallicola sp.]